MLTHKEFLKTKEQFYTKIDYFMPFKIYEKYKEKLKLNNVIQIIGTNGKGSTGRFLTQLLFALGYKVGHYTSPHIFSFNERFFLNEKIIDDENLEISHQKLFEILKNDIYKLSYFEYATFLSAVVFKDCDFVILEAGVGGEYDATSVFDKKLNIFTNIDFDHTNILGKNLKDIARTKLKLMSKNSIMQDKNQKKVVLSLAKKIAILKNANLFFAKDFIDDEINKHINNYVRKYNLASFLKNNLKLAMSACIFLNSKKECLNALKKINSLNLKGRLEKISNNLYIDVGHNVMAAKAIVKEFKNNKIDLIYNSFLDKNIFNILKTLKPIIDKIKIYDYKVLNRQLANDEILRISNVLDIKCERFKELDLNKKNLVFGSFILIENFLKDYGIEK